MNPTVSPSDADDEAHLQQLDRAAEESFTEALRQGLEDVAHGRTRPAREVFDEMRREFDIPPNERELGTPIGKPC